MRRLILRSMLNHKPVYYRRRRAAPYLFQTEAAFLCQMSGIASMAGRIGGARLAGTCSPVYQSHSVCPLFDRGGDKTALQASCHDTSILGASAPVVHLPYNVALPILFYQGQPVITLAMMDKAHRRPEDTAGRNFRAHQNKLIEGKDDFVRSQRTRHYCTQWPHPLNWSEPLRLDNLSYENCPPCRARFTSNGWGDK